MDTVTLTFIATISGAIIGAFTSIVTTYMTTKNAIRNQNNIDRLKREDSTRQFYKNTLIDTQELLLNFFGLISNAHMERVHFYNQGNDDKELGLIGDEWNEDIRGNTRKIVVLSERIIDEKIRKNLLLFKNNGLKLITERQFDKSLTLIVELMKDYDELNRLIGQQLRKVM